MVKIILGGIVRLAGWIASTLAEEGVAAALLTYFSVAIFAVVETAMFLLIAALAKFNQAFLGGLGLSYYRDLLLRGLDYVALVTCIIGVAALIVEHSPGPLGRGLRSLFKRKGQ